MWLRRLDRRRRLYLVPFQWQWVLDHVGLTTAQCEEAAWTIQPDGRKYRGAEAINVALDGILGASIFGPIYRLPGLTWLQDHLYGWIAENRSRFPGVTPAVERAEGWRE